MCDNISLLRNSGGWLIWTSLMEHFDHVWCIHQVFGQFPACHIWGIVKPFPFNKVKQPQSFVMVINPAVKDLMDFPLM